MLQCLRFCQINSERYIFNQNVCIYPALKSQWYLHTKISYEPATVATKIRNSFLTKILNSVLSAIFIVYLYLPGYQPYNTNTYISQSSEKDISNYQPKNPSFYIIFSFLCHSARVCMFVLLLHAFKATRLYRINFIIDFKRFSLKWFMQ